MTRYENNENDELEYVYLPDYYSEDYEYDARGNLTSVVNGGHGLSTTTNYAYNAKDQLISYGTNGTPVVTHGYDYRCLVIAIFHAAASASAYSMPAFLNG